MAGYSFVVDSEFQPLSYQELLHPVITQTQYQRQLEDKYTQLDLQADKLEQLANNAVDYESYEKYKSFSDQLRVQAARLSKYGLEGKDYGKFNDLFRQYGKEIQPLLDAQAKREQLIKMQQQISLQDPTSLFDRSAGNISLQELMSNPSAAPVRHSGELLRAQASNAAKNIQKELRNYAITKTKTPGYLAFTKQHGLKGEEVEAFVRNPNDPKANRVLKAIYNQVLSASGITDSWEGNALQKAGQYVGLGLWDAVGQSDVAVQEDKAYFMALEDQYRAKDEARKANYEKQRQLRAARLARRAAGASASATQRGATISHIPYNTRSLTGVDAPTAEYQQFKNFEKKGYYKTLKNGKIKMTDEGMLALVGGINPKLNKKTGNPLLDLWNKATQPIAVKPDKEFVAFVARHNSSAGFGTMKGNRLSMNRGLMEQGLTKLNKQYIDKKEFGNAKETTAFVMPLGENMDRLRTMVAASYGDEVNTVTFKNGKFRKTGKIDKDQLMSANVEDIEISKYGITMPVTYKDKNGKMHTAKVEVPPEVASTAYSRIMTAVNNFHDANNIVTEGKYLPQYDVKKYQATGIFEPLKDRNGNILYSNTPMTDLDRQQISNSLPFIIDDIMNYGSMLYQPYKPKGTEMAPFNYLQVDQGLGGGGIDESQILQMLLNGGE